MVSTIDIFIFFLPDCYLYFYRISSKFFGIYLDDVFSSFNWLCYIGSLNFDAFMYIPLEILYSCYNWFFWKNKITLGGV